MLIPYYEIYKKIWVLIIRLYNAADVYTFAQICAWLSTLQSQILQTSWIGLCSDIHPQLWEKLWTLYRQALQISSNQLNLPQNGLN